MPLGFAHVETYNFVQGGRTTVTTAGTEVQLSGTDTPCLAIEVTALLTNTSYIFIGGSDVVAASGSEEGTPLAAGDTWYQKLQNLTQVYIDSRVNGEGVSYNYFS